MAQVSPVAVHLWPFLCDFAGRFRAFLLFAFFSGGLRMPLVMAGSPILEQLGPTQIASVAYRPQTVNLPGPTIIRHAWQTASESPIGCRNDPGGVGLRGQPGPDLHQPPGARQEIAHARYALPHL